MLFSTSGMLIMATANDLVVIFVAIEILSIALYVLAGFQRAQAASQEAALKYFILGAFSSAIFLYGVALIYGATGTTLINGGSTPQRLGIVQTVAAGTADGKLVLVGLVLVMVGLGFKVAAVPFHSWSPDVYQGAPTPVTGFMSAATKAAAFAATVRVFVLGFGGREHDWRPALWLLTVLTLVIGAAVGLRQNDVKRMMAYSSINHAGYVLIGVQAATDQGVASVCTYLFTYTFLVLGSFAVLTALTRQGDGGFDLGDLRGLAGRQPVLAGLFTLFLLGQAGIPLTSGFVAKLQVFSAAVDRHVYSLAVIGMLASVVATFVYLRIVVAMYAGGDDAHATDHAADHGDGGPAGWRSPWRPRPGCASTWPRAWCCSCAPASRCSSASFPASCSTSPTARCSAGNRPGSTGQPGEAPRRRRAGRRSGGAWRRGPGLEEPVRQHVGLVADVVVVGEVEDGAPVGGPGQLDDLHARRRERPLDLPTLLAGDGEGVEQGVPWVPGRPGHEAAGDVEDVDLARRPAGERVRHGDVVDDGAVDEHPAVVDDRRQQPGQGGRRQQRRGQPAGGEDHLVAGGLVGGDHPEGDGEVVERPGREALDEADEPRVGHQVALLAHDLPGAGPGAAGEEVLGRDRRPDPLEAVDALQRRRGGHGGGVQRAHGRPDQHVGDDPVLEQRLQHPHLGDAVVAPAGQDEGDVGAARVPAGPRLLHAVTQALDAESARHVGGPASSWTGGPAGACSHPGQGSGTSSTGRGCLRAGFPIRERVHV